MYMINIYRNRVYQSTDRYEIHVLHKNKNHGAVEKSRLRRLSDFSRAMRNTKNQSGYEPLNLENVLFLNGDSIDATDFDVLIQRFS